MSQAACPLRVSCPSRDFCPMRAPSVPVSLLFSLFLRVGCCPTKASCSSQPQCLSRALAFRRLLALSRCSARPSQASGSAPFGRLPLHSRFVPFSFLLLSPISFPGPYFLVPFYPLFCFPHFLFCFAPFVSFLCPFPVMFQLPFYSRRPFLCVASPHTISFMPGGPRPPRVPAAKMLPSTPTLATTSS